jgi:hypothetical protein
VSDEQTSSEVAELRRELSAARSWAWGAHHRMWDYRWFPTMWRPNDRNGDWNLPDWLATSVAPDRQAWFVDPDTPPQAGRATAPRKGT